MNDAISQQLFALVEDGTLTDEKFDKTIDAVKKWCELPDEERKKQPLVLNRSIKDVFRNRNMKVTKKTLYKYFTHTSFFEEYNGFRERRASSVSMGSDFTGRMSSDFESDIAVEGALQKGDAHSNSAEKASLYLDDGQEHAAKPSEPLSDDLLLTPLPRYQVYQIPKDIKPTITFADRWWDRGDHDKASASTSLSLEIAKDYPLFLGLLFSDALFCQEMEKEHSKLKQQATIAVQRAYQQDSYIVLDYLVKHQNHTVIEGQAKFSLADFSSLQALSQAKPIEKDRWGGFLISSDGGIALKMETDLSSQYCRDSHDLSAPDLNKITEALNAFKAFPLNDAREELFKKGNAKAVGPEIEKARSRASNAVENAEKIVQKKSGATQWREHTKSIERQVFPSEKPDSSILVSILKSAMQSLASEDSQPPLKFSLLPDIVCADAAFELSNKLYCIGTFRDQFNQLAPLTRSFAALEALYQFFENKTDLEFSKFALNNMIKFLGQHEEWDMACLDIIFTLCPEYKKEFSYVDIRKMSVAERCTKFYAAIVSEKFSDVSELRDACKEKLEELVAQIKDQFLPLMPYLRKIKAKPYETAMDTFSLCDAAIDEHGVHTQEYVDAKQHVIDLAGTIMKPLGRFETVLSCMSSTTAPLRDTVSDANSIYRQESLFQQFKEAQIRALEWDIEILKEQKPYCEQQLKQRENEEKEMKAKAEALKQSLAALNWASVKNDKEMREAYEEMQKAYQKADEESREAGEKVEDLKCFINRAKEDIDRISREKKIWEGASTVPNAPKLRADYLLYWMRELLFHFSPDEYKQAFIAERKQRYMQPYHLMFLVSEKLVEQMRQKKSLLEPYEKKRGMDKIKSQVTRLTSKVVGSSDTHQLSASEISGIRDELASLEKNYTEWKTACLQCCKDELSPDELLQKAQSLGIQHAEVETVLKQFKDVDFNEPLSHHRCQEQYQRTERSAYWSSFKDFYEFAKKYEKEMQSFMSKLQKLSVKELQQKWPELRKQLDEVRKNIASLDRLMDRQFEEEAPQDLLTPRQRKQLKASIQKEERTIIRALNQRFEKVSSAVAKLSFSIATAQSISTVTDEFCASLEEEIRLRKLIDRPSIHAGMPRMRHDYRIKRIKIRNQINNLSDQLSNELSSALNHLTDWQVRYGYTLPNRIVNKRRAKNVEALRALYIQLMKGEPGVTSVVLLKALIDLRSKTNRYSKKLNKILDSEISRIQYSYFLVLKSLVMGKSEMFLSDAQVLESAIRTLSLSELFGENKKHLKQLLNDYFEARVKATIPQQPACDAVVSKFFSGFAFAETQFSLTEETDFGSFAKEPEKLVDGVQRYILLARPKEIYKNTFLSQLAAWLATRKIDQKQLDALDETIQKAILSEVDSVFNEYKRLVTQSTSNASVKPQLDDVLQKMDTLFRGNIASVYLKTSEAMQYTCNRYIDDSIFFAFAHYLERQLSSCGDRSPKVSFFDQFAAYLNELSSDTLVKDRLKDSSYLKDKLSFCLNDFVESLFDKIDFSDREMRQCVFEMILGERAFLDFNGQQYPDKASPTIFYLRECLCECFAEKLPLQEAICFLKTVRTKTAEINQLFSVVDAPAGFSANVFAREMQKLSAFQSKIDQKIYAFVDRLIEGLVDAPDTKASLLALLPSGDIEFLRLGDSSYSLQASLFRVISKTLESDNSDKAEKLIALFTHLYPDMTSVKTLSQQDSELLEKLCALYVTRLLKSDPMNVTVLSEFIRQGGMLKVQGRLFYTQEKIITQCYQYLMSLNSEGVKAFFHDANLASDKNFLVQRILEQEILRQPFNIQRLSWLLKHGNPEIAEAVHTFVMEQIMHSKSVAEAFEIIKQYDAYLDGLSDRADPFCEGDPISGLQPTGDIVTAIQKKIITSFLDGKAYSKVWRYWMFASKEQRQYYQRKQRANTLAQRLTQSIEEGLSDELRALRVFRLNLLVRAGDSRSAKRQKFCEDLKFISAHADLDVKEPLLDEIEALYSAVSSEFTETIRNVLLGKEALYIETISRRGEHHQVNEKLELFLILYHDVYAHSDRAVIQPAAMQQALRDALAVLRVYLNADHPFMREEHETTKERDARLLLLKHCYLIVESVGGSVILEEMHARLRFLYSLYVHKGTHYSADQSDRYLRIEKIVLSLTADSQDPDVQLMHQKIEELAMLRLSAEDEFRNGCLLEKAKEDPLIGLQYRLTKARDIWSRELGSIAREKYKLNDQEINDIKRLRDFIVEQGYWGTKIDTLKMPDEIRAIYETHQRNPELMAVITVSAVLLLTLRNSSTVSDYLNAVTQLEELVASITEINVPQNWLEKLAIFKKESQQLQAHTQEYPTNSIEKILRFKEKLFLDMAAHVPLRAVGKLGELAIAAEALGEEKPGLFSDSSPFGADIQAGQQRLERSVQSSQNIYALLQSIVFSIRDEKPLKLFVDINFSEIFKNTNHLLFILDNTKAVVELSRLELRVHNAPTTNLQSRALLKCVSDILNKRTSLINLSAPEFASCSMLTQKHITDLQNALCGIAFRQLLSLFDLKKSADVVLAELEGDYAHCYSFFVSNASGELQRELHSRFEKYMSHTHSDLLIAQRKLFAYSCKLQSSNHQSVMTDEQQDTLNGQMSRLIGQGYASVQKSHDMIQSYLASAPSCDVIRILGMLLSPLLSEETSEETVAFCQESLDFMQSHLVRGKPFEAMEILQILFRNYEHITQKAKQHPILLYFPKGKLSVAEFLLDYVLENELSRAAIIDRDLFEKQMKTLQMAVRYVSRHAAYPVDALTAWHTKLSHLSLDQEQLTYGHEMRTTMKAFIEELKEEMFETFRNSWNQLRGSLMEHECYQVTANDLVDLIGSSNYEFYFEPKESKEISDFIADLYERHSDRKFCLNEESERFNGLMIDRLECDLQRLPYVKKVQPGASPSFCHIPKA